MCFAYKNSLEFIPFLSESGENSKSDDYSEAVCEYNIEKKCLYVMRKAVKKHFLSKFYLFDSTNIANDYIAYNSYMREGVSDNLDMPLMNVTFYY